MGLHGVLKSDRSLTHYVYTNFDFEKRNPLPQLGVNLRSVDTH